MIIIIYFKLKSKIYVKRAPLIEDNTVAENIIFVNINFFKHINPIVNWYLYSIQIIIQEALWIVLVTVMKTYQKAFMLWSFSVFLKGN